MMNLYALNLNLNITDNFNAECVKNSTVLQKAQVAERIKLFDKVMHLIVLCTNRLLNLHYPPSSFNKPFENGNKHYLKHIFNKRKNNEKALQF